jgi:hypothetical protein
LDIAARSKIHTAKINNRKPNQIVRNAIEKEKKRKKRAKRRSEVAASTRQPKAPKRKQGAAAMKISEKIMEKRQARPTDTIADFPHIQKVPRKRRAKKAIAEEEDVVSVPSAPSTTASVSAAPATTTSTAPSTSAENDEDSIFSDSSDGDASMSDVYSDGTFFFLLFPFCLFILTH